MLRNLWNSAPPALGPFGPIKLLEYQTDLDLDFRALRECDPRQVLSTFQCKWIIATAFYEHKTPTTECKKCLNFPAASGGWGVGGGGVRDWANYPSLTWFSKKRPVVPPSLISCSIWWKPSIIVLTVCQTGWDPQVFGQLQLTRWPYSSLLREQEDTPSVILFWVSDSHISSRDFSGGGTTHFC